MPDLEIIFKTKAELAGAIAAREALERQVGAAKALGQATTELEAKIARMNQTLAQHAAAGGEGGLGHFLAQISEQALKAIPGLEGVAGAVGKLASGSLTAAGVGLQTAALGFKTISASIAQFAQAEAGVARLDLALAQAGQLTDAYREKLQELAHELSESTAKSGGEWLGVLQRLTQFGAKPENISEYAEAVKNLAGIMGGDLAEAAHIFSRAIEGNFAFLHRYGIRIESTGDHLKDMQSLMQQLALKGGGQLEAMAVTLSGRWTTLEHETARVTKGLGQMFSEAVGLNRILSLLGDMAAIAADGMAKPMKAAGDLANAANVAAASLDATKHAMGEFASAQERIKTAAQGAADALERQHIAAGKLLSEQDKAEAANKALALAQIGWRLAKKQITPEQAEVEKQATEQFYMTEAFHRDRARLEEDRSFAGKKIVQLGGASLAAGTAVEQQEAVVIEARRRQALKLRSEKAQANVEDLDTQIAKLTEQTGGVGREPIGPDWQPAHAWRLEQLERLKGLKGQRAGAERVAERAAAAVPEPMDVRAEQQKLDKLQAEDKTAKAAAAKEMPALTEAMQALTKELQTRGARYMVERETLRIGGEEEQFKAHEKAHEAKVAAAIAAIKSMEKGVPDIAAAVKDLSDTLLDKIIAVKATADAAMKRAASPP